MQLTQFVLLSLIVAAAAAAVLQVPIIHQNRKVNAAFIESKLAKHPALKKALLNKRVNTAGIHRGSRLDQTGADGKSTSTPVESFDWYNCVANVTVGTPGVRLPVEFNTEDADFWVLGPHNDLHNKRASYDSSKSSSNKQDRRQFSADHGYVVGNLTNDVVNIGDFSTPVTFGVASRAAAWIDYTPISGEFGLSPKLLSNGIQTQLQQFLAALGEPIVAIHAVKQENKNLPAEGLVTLGGEDLINCDGPYTYTQLSAPDYWQFNINAVKIVEKDGKDFNFEFLVGKTSFIEYSNVLWAPESIAYQIIKSTDAVYDHKSGQFNLTSADPSNFPTITLLTGGESNVQITLSYDDLVVKKDDGQYTLAIMPLYEDSNGEKEFYLGAQILRRRCISVNYKTQEIGIASTRSA